MRDLQARCRAVDEVNRKSLARLFQSGLVYTRQGARLGRDLCDKTPDYDELHRRYWYHVYRIHDRMNPGPHPHPARMADALIQRFRSLPD